MFSCLWKWNKVNYRHCNNPKPRCGGKICQGMIFEYKPQNCVNHCGNRGKYNFLKLTIQRYDTDIQYTLLLLLLLFRLRDDVLWYYFTFTAKAISKKSQNWQKLWGVMPININNMKKDVNKTKKRHWFCFCYLKNNKKEFVAISL